MEGSSRLGCVVSMPSLGFMGQAHRRMHQLHALTILRKQTFKSMAGKRSHLRLVIHHAGAPALSTLNVHLGHAGKEVPAIDLQGQRGYQT